MLQQKAELEQRRKEAEDLAIAKETERDREVKKIGNYVHDSVPVSNNEVSQIEHWLWIKVPLLTSEFL